MAEDFISEARAEYRAQQTRALLRRSAPWAAGVAVVVLGAVGVWQWRAYENRQERLAASAQYFEAVQAIEDASAAGNAHGLTDAQRAAEKSLAHLVSSAPADIRDFAAIRLATLRLADHDRPGAMAAWKSVVDDAKASPDLKSLAHYLSLNASMADGDPAALRRGFEQLASSAGPWRALAQEGLVALDLRPGTSAAQQEEAHHLLLRISEAPDAPDGVRQRAGALLQTFGPVLAATEARKAG